MMAQSIMFLALRMDRSNPLKVVLKTAIFHIAGSGDSEVILEHLVG
jgi:hypothetical protein